MPHVRRTRACRDESSWPKLALLALTKVQYGFHGLPKASVSAALGGLWPRCWHNGTLSACVLKSPALLFIMFFPVLTTHSAAPLKAPC